MSDFTDILETLGYDKVEEIHLTKVFPKDLDFNGAVSIKLRKKYQ